MNRATDYGFAWSVVERQSTVNVTKTHRPASPVGGTLIALLHRLSRKFFHPLLRMCKHILAPLNQQHPPLILLNRLLKPDFALFDLPNDLLQSLHGLLKG